MHLNSMHVQICQQCILRGGVRKLEVKERSEEDQGHYWVFKGNPRRHLYSIVLLRVHMCNKHLLRPSLVPTEISYRLYTKNCLQITDNTITCSSSKPKDFYGVSIGVEKGLLACSFSLCLPPLWHSKRNAMLVSDIIYHLPGNSAQFWELGR